MHSPRPTPFDLVFESLAQTTFPAIHAGLDQGGQDPRDRDAFLMQREVVTLLRELRPDEGLGEGIHQLAAFIHHAYLYWDGGASTVEISPERLRDLLDTSSDRADVQPEPRAYYAQLPELRIWASVIPGQPHEPLDGCFVHSLSDPKTLRVLGVFGIQPDRPGFSVVEVAGRRPAALVRADGSAVFSPTLPGGAAAGLFSLAGEEELLELGWLTIDVATGASLEATRWRA
jgi:hypothetical protein